MNRAILLVMACLVTAALVGGFMVVGGPEQARAEERDRARAQAIYRLRSFLICTGRAAQPLPATLDDTGYCPQERFAGLVVTDVDARIADSIRYRRVSDNRFELCTTFETDAARAARILRTLPEAERREDASVCVTGQNGFAG